jgi:hypothetical protein
LGAVFGFMLAEKSFDTGTVSKLYVEGPVSGVLLVMHPQQPVAVNQIVKGVLESP